jgi:hypothetical protein
MSSFTGKVISKTSLPTILLSHPWHIDQHLYYSNLQLTTMLKKHWTALFSISDWVWPFDQSKYKEAIGKCSWCLSSSQEERHLSKTSQAAGQVFWNTVVHGAGMWHWHHLDKLRQLWISWSSSTGIEDQLRTRSGIRLVQSQTRWNWCAKERLKPQIGAGEHQMYEGYLCRQYEEVHISAMQITIVDAAPIWGFVLVWLWS